MGRRSADGMRRRCRDRVGRRSADGMRRRRRDRIGRGCRDWIRRRCGDRVSRRCRDRVRGNTGGRLGGRRGDGVGRRRRDRVRRWPGDGVRRRCGNRTSGAHLLPLGDARVAPRLRDRARPAGRRVGGRRGRRAGRWWDSGAGPDTRLAVGVDRRCRDGRRPAPFGGGRVLPAGAGRVRRSGSEPGAAHTGPPRLRREGRRGRVRRRWRDVHPGTPRGDRRRRLGGRGRATGLIPGRPGGWRPVARRGGHRTVHRGRGTAARVRVRRGGHRTVDRGCGAVASVRRGRRPVGRSGGPVRLRVGRAVVAGAGHRCGLLAVRCAPAGFRCAAVRLRRGRGRALSTGCGGGRILGVRGRDRRRAVRGGRGGVADRRGRVARRWPARAGRVRASGGRRRRSERGFRRGGTELHAEPGGRRTGHRRRVVGRSGRPARGPGRVRADDPGCGCAGDGCAGRRGHRRRRRRGGRSRRDRTRRRGHRPAGVRTVPGRRGDRAGEGTVAGGGGDGRAGVWAVAGGGGDRRAGDGRARAGTANGRRVRLLVARCAFRPYPAPPIVVAGRWLGAGAPGAAGLGRALPLRPRLRVACGLPAPVRTHRAGRRPRQHVVVLRLGTSLPVRVDGRAPVDVRLGPSGRLAWRLAARVGPVPLRPLPRVGIRAAVGVVTAVGVVPRLGRLTRTSVLVGVAVVLVPGVTGAVRLGPPSPVLGVPLPRGGVVVGVVWPVVGAWLPAARPGQVPAVTVRVVGTPVPLGLTPRVAGAAGRLRGAPVVAGGCPVGAVPTAGRWLLVRLGHPPGLGARAGGDGRGGRGRPAPAHRLGPGRARLLAVMARLAVPAVVPGGPVLAAGAAVGPLGAAVRRGAAGRRALLGPGGLGVRAAVRLVVVALPGPAVVAAVPVLLGERLVGPGSTHVRAVGAGRGERRHVGAADDAGPSARRWWRCVLDADVPGVTLAGELGMPLVGRFEHPGRFGRVRPPVGIPAVHPACPSPRRGRVPRTG
ncbi:hypothetical protein GA0070620_6026 [Micromonospora krabiensis]|uniref:Uncharacterized protein n=1 Tax=Micromonospora krabiensis TaxID=307121 RepID=A0A1C3ND05_9ACTN|nr:hypothetical protein GA0070620_6026 [Micromonospora krabiensis]